MSSQDDHEDKYRILVEQASDGIAIYDRNGNISEVNSRACELIGYSRDELLSKNVSDVIAPDDLENTPLRYEALQNGQSLLGERVLIRKDGTALPVELSARMLSDGRFQVIIRDITQRRMMEAEVSRSRDFYLTILEDLPAMIWRAGTDTRCNYFNRTWLRFRGRTAEEELVDCWQEGVHPDDLAHFLDAYQAAFHARQPFVLEYRLRRHDGEYRWIRNHGSPFNDLSGNFAGYLVSAHDFTERRRAEDEVKRLNAELEQRVTERTSQLAAANRDLRAEVTERMRLLQSEQEARQEAESAVQIRDELLAIVSHDLKNPLAAIKGNSQLVRKRITQAGGPSIERSLAPLARIDEAAARMTILLNDLLDFGRLQAGQSLTLQRRPTDLVALAGNVAFEFQQTTEHHRIEVIADPTHLVGPWDNARLEQVLDNLMSNAIKYSPNGGQIKLEITCENDKTGKAWAVLSVRDEGMGIAAEDIPHIFEWYRRARSASGRISGAGIGLASANYIVTQHGGTISVVSEPGKGAIFTVRLPM